MWEQSKAARRRYYDGAFHNRYFVGRGIDIGGKPDPLAQYAGVFPRLESVRTWDMEDGDAQTLTGVADGAFDFVHASHSLEHMVDVMRALSNWIRVVRPGGFLIITVPDEDLYELGHWPSKFNPDHKWTFTLAKTRSWSPRSLNVIDLARQLAHQLEVERLWLVRDFFREPLRERQVDQTITPVAECAIEIVWRKRTETIASGAAGNHPAGSGAQAVLPERDLYRPLFSPWLGGGDFARHYATAAAHTIVSAERCWVLYTLARQALRFAGDFWECGVYRGGTAALLASVIAETPDGYARRLHLFDTFAGMPVADEQRDLHRAGDFSDVSLEAVRRTVGNAAMVQFHPGRIPQTFAGMEPAEIAFAHVDVDLYRSVLDCCAFIYPRLATGGFMVFDDYGFPTCPGARAAVDEFFRETASVPLVLSTGQAVVFKSG